MEIQSRSMRPESELDSRIQVTTRLTKAEGTLRELRRGGLSRVERLDIFVRADPDNHDWHQTSLGPLRVDSITEDESGNKVILLNHQNRSQLGKKTMRIIPLNEDGIGSQQLKRHGMQDRWLHINASPVLPIEAIRPDQV